jgi:DNA-binding transcriptional ArsR family regulator
MNVSELAQLYSMSLNAVSKHVKTLDRAGLIRRSIRGREHSCQLEVALERSGNAGYCRTASARRPLRARFDARTLPARTFGNATCEGWTQILAMLGRYSRQRAVSRHL